MNTTSKKNVMSKLAFSLLASGVLWAGSVWADDIVSIKSDQANSVYTDSGRTIDFKITLNGTFYLDNSLGGTAALLPEIRMIVNGDVAYAQLYSLSQYTIAAGTLSRTDCIFRYITKAGDMAQPLRIYGSPTVPYQFFWNSWQIRNFTTTSNAVWKFYPAGTGPGSSVPGEGEVYDLDLVKANITIRNLSFDESHSPVSVAATESATWRVSTVNPIGPSVVDFYVWTPGTNILQIGTVPNQTALLVSMATGVTFVDFPLKGLAVGTTEVYLQRTKDFQNNGTVGVTNYIKRTITITTPPEPTIYIKMNDTGTDNTTLDESTSLNTGSFHLELSEAFSNDVWVRIDSAPLGQSNVTFAAAPYIVKIPAGLLVSSEAKFNVPDGTPLSASAGITLTPVPTNALAAAKYTRLRDGTVYVRNVAPVLTQPLATDAPQPVMNTPFAFNWSVSDVAPDLASGMTVAWDFGDGKTTNVTGAAGMVLHTYAGAANSYVKVVKVTAYDKDGGVSAQVQFSVTVVKPEPQPSVTVVPSATTYDETSTNNTGSLVLQLSEVFMDDVWVKLSTDPASQSSIVFSTTNAIRISAGTNLSQVIKFSIPDGTPDSGSAGITIIPTVTNAVAADYFKDMRSAPVFVNNLNPIVTRPVAGDLLAASVPPFNKVPMGNPYTFDYTVKDVPADLDSMIVRWRFESGGTTYTVTGAVGQISFTYTSLGDKFVWLQAQDKDGGFSDEIEFKVTVVEPPPPPTVSILPPAGPLSETTAPNTGEFTVQLSEPFTEIVTVALAVSPGNDAVNGAIVLATNRVTFTVGQVSKVVRFTARDGTDLSWINGFVVTPTVVASAAAIARYTEISPGTVQIMNVLPAIQAPTPSDITSTAVTYTVPQGSPWTFNWVINDVAPDSTTTPTAYAMRAIWYFGDGAVQTGYGGSGSITHTYTVLGDVIVRMVAIDKDGGQSEVQFKIRVLPSKAVNVTPLGPNFESTYYGAAGLGNGMVASPEARSSQNLSDVYFFKYEPSVASATLMAIPYKTGPSGSYACTNFTSSGTPYIRPGYNAIEFDSFFYVWVGTDQGIAEEKLNPMTTTAVVPINLPTIDTSGTTVPSVEIRDVQAIFSREYRKTDNMGDINNDGIPDKIAMRYDLPSVGGGGGTGGNIPADLVNVASYNGDEDFLPGAASGGGAIIGGVSNVFATIGDPFTAYLEVRGFHPGLNNVMYGSDPDGPADEPGTDPTKFDTDGDVFPDGWEYYFWYNAKFQNMTGEAYNPYDVATGTLIPTKTIMLAFDPLVPATDNTTGAAINRDLDNDGLSDMEELAAGTNPVHWDTDSDGMCDGWEVLRGLNPNDSRDGLSRSVNNPDGDYFAITTVPRQFVTVVSGENVTNTYLAQGAAVAAATGTFTTWFHYGASNSAPIAVGRPVTLPGDAIVTELVEMNALIMHFQVYAEFGFDPRTAWIGAVGRVAGWAAAGNGPPPDWNNFMNDFTSFSRFPPWVASDAPNTRPFTAIDEYLLMKFMSENRVNGAGDAIGAGDADNKTQEWSDFSTHPKTPDSDALAAGSDGLPDGWELYVSCSPGTRNMVITPWSWLDGDDDLDLPAPPGDGLTVQREFAGTDTSAAYAAAGLYGAGLATVTITRPAVDALWFNKFWPTNPWADDTDTDTMSDSAERAFMYGAPVDNGSDCIQGGGLNPCSMDTDRDALTDTWERDFTGTLPGGNVAYGGIVVSNGMDGTVSDYLQDWDHDGLLNYQEYWVQAVRNFRYDMPAEGVTGPITGNAGLPMDMSFNPASLFTQVINAWDIAKYPWGFPVAGVNLWLLLPVGPNNQYVSTDPRDEDTDLDAMDDFYEMFHGLNPILGEGILASGLDDRIGRAYIDNGAWTIDWGTALLGNDWGAGLPMDFMTYPWLTGMPECDPDADGLRNLEEKLQPNVAAPPYSNTDPSAMWLTDSTNPESVTLRFYRTLSMFFWPGTLSPIIPFLQPPFLMYTHELNEGYDTDNDGLSDKAEMVDSRNRAADPQDHDDPIRRQALWFSGASSAARTLESFSFGEWTFRSFTVELWARPEVVTRDQVLLERTLAYRPSDLSNSGTPFVLRRNFRLGIAADGRVYAMFENAGTHESHTASVFAYGPVLTPGEWVHVTARMDGLNSQFTLFINGDIRTSTITSLIPANGITNLEMVPGVEEPVGVTVYSGVLVLGAADINPSGAPQTWADYEQFYQGWIDEVRIWDGARTNDEVKDNYKSRFTKKELWENRVLVRTQELRGFSRVMTNQSQLAPELLYHFTFDNLFSADAAGSVATSPRGFNDPQVSVNRPADPLANVGWWSAMLIHSDVYNDYNVVPWIENGVDHLPLFGGVTTNGVGGFLVLATNEVRNSIYWTHTMAGATPGSFSFPNSNDPYGLRYETAISPLLASFEVHGDLLPLGGAYARQSDSMWDGQGASGVWNETGTDTDSDGLPDWWETYLLSLYPTATGLGWDDLYPDGSGMTNGERYQRDIAKGATPTNPTGLNGIPQTADSDGDGLPDWWENLFHLNPSYPNGASGMDGAGGDADLDGLSNLAEYQITEVYGFQYLSPRLFTTAPLQTVSDYYLKQGEMTYGAMFSDHDFMEDAWEDMYHPYYVNRFVYDPDLDYDEDGWSNWAECRYEKNALKSDPSMGMHLDTEGFSTKDFPVPVIKTRVSYDGMRTEAQIVIQAYSTPDMDGLPDAVFTLPAPPTTVNQLPTSTKNLGFWGSRKITGYLSPGSIVPGTIQMTFTDVSPDAYGYTVTAAFDVFADVTGRTGNIVGTDGSGWEQIIGTINYITGYYEIDLSWYQGISIVQLISPTEVAVVTPNTSYVIIEYQNSQVEGWPKTAYLSDADTGYIREGMNYFFAFMDLNNNDAWDAGEPCGVATPLGTDINWDYNSIMIELTDYTPNYLRMTLSPGLRSEDVYMGTGGNAGGGGQTAAVALQTRVRIRRTVVDGSLSYQKIVLDKLLDLRAFLHEGDFLTQGALGLDWGLVDVPTTMNRDAVGYEVFVGDSAVLTNNLMALSFTNRFDAVQAQAVSTYPINGAYVYASRPTFRWTMPDGYTAFRLEVRKGSSTGPVVYDSGEVQAPVRDIITGEFVWEAPIHAGSKLPNGQIFASNTVYWWHVTALNPKFSLVSCGPCDLVWSNGSMFRLDVNSPMQSSGYGEVRAVVKYYGPATDLLSGRVKVQVFNNRGFTGVPVQQYTLSATDLAYLTMPGTTNVNAVLRGLAPSSVAGDYYVRAYIDQNLNNVRDNWESWGYANYYGVNDTPYEVRPMKVAFSTLNSPCSVVIEDADTDQDWFPDAWEYQQNPGEDFLGNIGPSSDWDGIGNTEVNTGLQTGGVWAGMSMMSALALGTTDLDGDGLDDMAELILGTDALSTSTSGDGYTDGDKASLGLSPDDSMVFGVTGFGLSGATADVQWKLDIQKASSANPTLLSAVTGVSSDGMATYYIDYTPSLSNPSWTTVESGTVTLEGTQTFLEKISTASQVIDPAKGFFRVRLAK